MFETEIKKIKRTSQICLWGSVAVVILTALFLYATPWCFTQTRQVSDAMMLSGSVLTVLAVSMALLTIRKRVPRLRQAESLDTKLKGYASHVSSFYGAIFVVVLVLAVLAVLANRRMLLPLSMLTTLMLFLAFPNIYRMKVDLGLTDDEMRSLFGDEYIPDERPEEPVEQNEEETKPENED